MTDKKRMFNSNRHLGQLGGGRRDGGRRGGRVSKRRQLFERLEDRRMLAGVLTYGDEDLLGLGVYPSDPKTGAILSGLAPGVISDSTVRATHALNLVGSPTNYAGTDQIYVGSNQTGTHDAYAASSDRRAGPQLISMNYASLVTGGSGIDTLTLGIAADDFQFDQFDQPFIARINGTINSALTTKLNSLSLSGATQFFTIGIDPRQLTPDHILTLSIDSGGDGGDGWAIDFLTVGVTNSRYEVRESTVKIIDSQSVVSFGAARLGEVVTAKTFTLRNTSNSPLTLEPIIAPTGFSIVSNFSNGQVVAPGASATFSVQLDSANPGDHLGTLSFVTSDSDNPIFEFDLVGSVATNKGTDFWLAFQPNHPQANPTLTLFIAGEIASTGTISIPGGNYTAPFTVQPGVVTQIVIPTAVASQILPMGIGPIAAANDKISNAGIRVTSSAPIAVYGLNRSPATTDGFLGLPVNVIGIEYVVLSYGAAFSNSQSQQFSIVGVRDNTEVTITPSATIGTRTRGVPYTVTLNAGEVYYLVNTSGSEELSGTIIRSSNPVSVFSGHGSGQVPIGRPFTDHLTEQLPPVTSWASRFVTVPLGDQDQNLYRIVANADQTTIRVDGNVVATLNRGQAHTFERSTAALIEASRPVLVAQFARGGNDSNLDPFMQIVPAIDQFATNYTLATPTDIEFTRHWANVVVPSDQTGAIRRNGQLIPESNFTAIAGTNFSFAKLLLPRGTHQFESQGVPFGVTLYGWGNDDSYGYLGGQVFRQSDIEVLVDDVGLTSGLSTVDFGSVLVGTTSQKTFTVRNGAKVSEINLGQITLPTGYTLVSGPADVNLGPEESTTFVVAIDTATVGVRSGQLSIDNDDPDETPFIISLQGSVLAPNIEILDGPTLIANSVGSVDFGSTPQGRPITRTLTIRNTGSFELSLGAISVTPGSGFSVSTQPAPIVAPNGGETTMQIRLDAVTPEVRQAVVSIVNNDRDKNPFSFNLLGFVYDNVDLVVTDIQTSPTSTVGGQVDLTWTVRNQGTGEFRGRFSDNVSISTDATIGNDRSIGDFSFDGTLIPGQTVTRTQRITLPSDLAGPTYFVIHTDAPNQVVEDHSAQAESNNVSIDDQVLNILAADLQPLDVEIAPVLTTGASTRVNWKVQNIGSAATLVGASWKDEVYLSTDKVLDGNDILLAEVVRPKALAAKVGSVVDSYASFADVTIPYGTFGVKYVIVKSDSAATVVELEESNNDTTSQATNITWQPPDLQVKQVISHAFAFAGAPTRMTWEVINAGQTAMLASEASWRDRVFLSTDTILDSQDLVLGEFPHAGLLLPGEGYTQTVDVTMPGSSVLTADEYYLIVDADWRSEVNEGLLENNNWTSETSLTRIVRLAPPDLVVDSIGSIPASILAGQTLDVSFAVKNSGTGETEDTNTRWTDAVYLSTNDTLDTGDRLLGTVVRNGGLKPSDPPYTQSAGFSIPSDLAGDYKLIVVTNSLAEVFGDDLSNNQRVSTTSMTIQTPPADLDVISVTPATSTVVVGSSLAVNYVIRNVGPQATTVTNWTDRIFLSRDTVLDDSDLPFDSVVRTGALAAGTQYQGSATRTVDQVGEFYVLVQTDATDTVAEVVNGNNVEVSSQTVNVVATPADLTTSFLVVPSSARAGLDTLISYRVTNTGPTATLSSSWLDHIFLSADATLDGNDQLLKSISRIGTLESPEFYEVTTSITVPDGLAGQYHIIVHADALNAVFEQDNVDNIAVSALTVTLVSDPADLVVSSISAPAVNSVGQSVRVDWTVRNQGTGDTAVSRWREQVYLSDDNVWSATSDVLLGDFVYTVVNSSVDGPLGPGKSINRSEVVNIANDVLGDKFLFVVVDTTDVVFEQDDEDNNASVARPIKIVQRETDLQVLTVTAPANATQGVAFDVSWTVGNMGAAATSTAFWYDEVYLSTDNVLSANDSLLGSVQRSNSLNGAGQADNQYTVTSSFVIPIGLTLVTAPFFVLVKTDAGTLSLVPETLEDNNVAAAATATTVSPGPVVSRPDLSVASVGLISALTQVGQPITVNWSVENNGPADIVDGSWFDSVYLSLDQVLDYQNSPGRSRDIFLGFREQRNRSLAKDASYSDAGEFTIPAGLIGDYFVLVGTDSRNDIDEETTGELNNVGVGGTPLSVHPKAPADLVVGTITIPTVRISGQSATISYSVTNSGQTVATGSWYDSIYLSADATWDVNDALFGRVLHNGDVQPLDTYNESLTAALPGVLPGNYHVIIRSDIRNQIVESNDENNWKASLETFAMDVSTLTPGVSIDRNVGQGASAWFKISVPANRTLRLSVDSANNAADTQLFISKGVLPTQSQFDFSSSQAGQSDHLMLVPDTEEATYYVLVTRVASPGGAPKMTIQADVIGYSLLSTDRSRVGNSGLVTMAISGAQLRGTQTVSLVGAIPTVKRDATRIEVVDSSLMYATFDVTGLAAGSYSLQASNNALETATLSSPMTVEAARSGPVKLALNVPDTVKRGQTFQAILTVYNDGNVDAALPMVQFDSQSTLLLGQDASDLRDELLTVVVIPQGASPDTLRPGQSAQVFITAKENVGSGNTASLNVKTLSDSTAEVQIDREINVVAAQVSNDIVGPFGFGPQNWISATEPMSYSIQFENDPIFASSPAQKIEIKQTLDSDLDALSFRLGDFAIGDLLVDVPENQSYYSQRIDLRDLHGIFLDVTAGINVATSEAFWKFIAIDPATGEQPQDPLKGILPPNLISPEGTGFVRYWVNAKTGVSTGTRIDTQARIVFDINEPTDTPSIYNTLDAVKPTSQVAPLVPLLVANEARFPVRWSGSDDAVGSAIAGYDVYVNVDNKGFRPWLTNVTYTEALYEGPVGSTFAFYSIARDNAGNFEQAPANPDTTIRVVAPQDVRIEIGDRTIAGPGEVVEFSDAIVGSTAVQKTLTIRNSGNQPLVLGTASLSSGAGFRIVTNLADGLTLDPNASASLVVRFDTATIGSKTSTLQFGTNVPGESPFTLLLRGDVVPVPALQLTVDSETIREDGGTAIVTVTRNTRTTMPLTVNLTNNRPSRLSFPDSVTIPVGASSASFLVRAIDSAIAEGTQTADISAAAVGIASDSVSVSVTDNDTRGISITPTAGNVNEAGDTATFSVVLTSEPTATVTIPVSSSDLSEGTVTISELTFTPANWNIAQSVAVTGMDDALDDGDIAFDLVFGAATGGDYTGVDADDVSVTNIDDDTRGIMVSPISDNVTEAGGTAVFTVVLTSQPTASVTIPLSSSNSTEGTIAPDSLTFTSANWNVPQMVTVTGVDDNLDDGDIEFNIAIDPATGGDYAGLDATDVVVTNEDDDTRGITISAINGSTTEAGGTATFTVVLTSQPTGAVIIPLVSSDTTEGTVAPASLTFTPENWNVVQTVTVTGVDDNVDDGDIDFNIVTEPATGADYVGLDATDVEVSNVDDDARGITVSAIDRSTTEAGRTATFTVVLTSQPTGEVTIPLSSSDTTEGTVEPAVLSFTPSNWNVAQTVTVTGVDDDLDDGNIALTIVTAPAIGADYVDIDAIDVAVINVDNDTRGITVSTTNRNTTEAGGTATFTVVLTSQPTDSVTIPLSSSDTTEGRVSPARLTFTPDDWNVVQTVTITGANDHLDDGDISFNIVTGLATGGDYAGINPNDVEVINEDDDARGITVSEINRSTTEAGGTAVFAIRLNSQPTQNVTIPLTSSDTTEGTISSATLVFTPNNWNELQRFTVTGVNDDVDDGDIDYSIVTGPASGGDYTGINADDVAVTNLDNDTRGIMVTANDRETSEAGDTASLVVVLTSQPTENVTVSLSSSDTTEGTVAPSALTFTPSNWNVPQTVTVTGVDDNIDDGNIEFEIVTEAASVGDYAGINPDDVTIINVDSDAAPTISLSINNESIAEASGTSTITATLSIATTRPVTISLRFLGTANQTSDYRMTGTEIAIPAGQTTGNITITAVQDVIREDNESIVVDVVGVSYGITVASRVTLSVVDDDKAFDFGDAPAFYPVTIDQDGARHTMGPLFLGAGVNDELDGIASPNADSDQRDDGVIPISTLIATNIETTSSIAVVASQPGKLDGWIDFNGDRDWLDAGEQIFTSVNVVAGTNVLSFSIPAGANDGSRAARFRISTSGGLAPTGPANDGEVEDYMMTLVRGSNTAILDIDSPSNDTTLVVDGDEFKVESDDVILSKAPLARVGEVKLKGRTTNDLLKLAISQTLSNKKLEIDGGAGMDRLELIGSGRTLNLSDSSIRVREIETIDIRGSGANTLIVGLDDVKLISATSNSLEIVSDNDDTITFGDGWRAELPRIINGQFTHIISEDVEGGNGRIELRNNRFLQNPLNRFDVDRDGFIRPLDALVIINAIRRRGDGPFALPTNDSQISVFYFDVSGTNDLTPLEALLVINAIRRGERGTGESSSLNDSASSIEVGLTKDPSLETRTVIDVVPSLKQTITSLAETRSTIAGDAASIPLITDQASHHGTMKRSMAPSQPLIPEPTDKIDAIDDWFSELGQRPSVNTNEGTDLNGFRWL